MWTDEALEKLNEPRYEYNGKKLNETEASQIQRYNERQIRRWKREEIAMKAAGLDSSEAAAKVKYWQGVQDDFIKQTGFARQYERERVTTITQKLAEKIERKTNYARASDTFTVIPPMKGDAIKAQSIYKELHKSEVGKHAYDLIISKEISVEVNYTDEVEEGVRGYTFGNSIFVYARNTRTVRLTTETIIHEVTHIELDSHSHTQWEEAYCFAQEAKHKKPQLTYADLRYIIKTVKELYPEYPWR